MVEVGGNIFKGNFRDLSITFRPCIESTDTVQCATNSEFLEHFTDSKFYVWTTGNYFNLLGLKDGTNDILG